MHKQFLQAILLFFCTVISAQKHMSNNDFIFSDNLYVFDNSNIKNGYSPEVVYNKGVPTFNNLIGKQFEIVAYIATDEKGNSVITENEINEKISFLNSVFSRSYLKFYVCDFIKMKDPYYKNVANVESCNTVNVMVRDFYTKNKINLYFVGSIRNSFEQLENLVMMPDTLETNDFIVLANVKSNHLLIHSFGHFFGLYHTHENDLFGKELVMPSNEAIYSTGDLIFDTPAETNLSGDGFVDNECEYIATRSTDVNVNVYVEKDPQGNIYVPSVTNYMSHIPEQCAILLTDEQLYRVKTIIEKFYAYLR